MHGNRSRADPAHAGCTRGIFNSVSGGNGDDRNEPAARLQQYPRLLFPVLSLLPPKGGDQRRSQGGADGEERGEEANDENREQHEGEGLDRDGRMACH